MSTMKNRRTIRDYREARGWSQAELAFRSGVSPSTVYNWERGRNEPRVAQLRTLARVLGVTMENIAMTEDDKAEIVKIAA